MASPRKSRKIRNERQEEPTELIEKEEDIQNGSIDEEDESLSAGLLFWIPTLLISVFVGYYGFRFFTRLHDLGKKLKRFIIANIFKTQATASRILSKDVFSCTQSKPFIFRSTRSSCTVRASNRASWSFSMRLVPNIPFKSMQSKDSTFSLRYGPKSISM
jgi:hypothetical protein